MEHIDDDLDADVLKKLFTGLPRLQALDFAGCTSPSFKTAFSSLAAMDWPQTLSITRLSLHKCLTLPASVFQITHRPGVVSFSELAKHNTKDSCWLLIDGHVYDATSVLRWHPTGPGAVLEWAGRDAT